MIAIKARGIKKYYRKKAVLKGIDIDIEAGEIFCLLGPNGAGKTTLISIFSTLVVPDEGSVKIFEYDIFKHAKKIREIINITSGNPNFPWSLTVKENLNYYAMLYGIPKSKRKRKIEELINLFELEEYENTRFDELSSGLKQRLNLAKSLINDPKILFLDEPTIGLDPDIATKTRNLIKKIHEEKGITIVLTTHYMKEAEQLSDRIAFINRGRIISTGKKEDFLSGEKMIKIKYKENGRIFEKIFSAKNINKILKKIKGEVVDIDVIEKSLEDVFLELAK